LVEVLEEQVGFDFPADRRFLRRRKTGGFLMCRNIKRLHNFQPPATDEEIRASALQYVRKLSGFARPSKANQEAFARAVEEVTRASRELLDALVTTSPPLDREAEAIKAAARNRLRYGNVKNPAAA
jgi:hypothetical protein